MKTYKITIVIPIGDKYDIEIEEIDFISATQRTLSQIRQGFLPDGEIIEIKLID